MDGLRGIAILMVLAWHFGPCMRMGDYPYAIRLAHQMLGMSWSGVDLFFVLSGFLITGILLDKRDDPRRIRTFFLKRTCRILPLYSLLLLTYTVARSLPFLSSSNFEWLFQDPLPLLSFATFTQNFFMGLQGNTGPNFVGITWSLAVEEQFYLIIPWFAWLLPRRIFTGIVLTGIIAAPLLRLGTPSQLAFFGTPWRADSLLMGSLLALCVRHPGFMTGTMKRLPLLVGCWSLLVAGVGVKTLHPSWLAVDDHLWLSLTYAATILLTLTWTHGAVNALLCQSALVWFGTRSYGIYMLHQGVNGLLHGAILGHAPAHTSWQAAVVTGGVIIVTLVLAELSFRFFEGPFLAFAARSCRPSGSIFQDSETRPLPSPLQTSSSPTSSR